MGTAMVHLDEEALVKQEVDQVPLPKGVKFQRIEQSSAWTGEPAWRIYFTVTTSIPLTRNRLRTINAFSHAVEDRLLALRLGKWPFIELREAK